VIENRVAIGIKK